MTSGRFDGISKDIERKLKKMRLTRDVVIRRDHAKIEGRYVHFVLWKMRIRVKPETTRYDVPMEIHFELTRSFNVFSTSSDKWSERC